MSPFDLNKINKSVKKLVVSKQYKKIRNWKKKKLVKVAGAKWGTKKRKRLI